MISPSAICDIPYISEVTGIHKKKLAQMANADPSLLPHIADARMAWGKVFDWTEVRPVLEAMIDNGYEGEHTKPSDWPE